LLCCTEFHNPSECKHCSDQNCPNSPRCISDTMDFSPD
jgi:hypothetical protein